MSTLTASEVFSQLAALAEQDIFVNALPVINTTLANIQANPAQWTNPLSASLLANKFLVDLTATLPSLENTAVSGAATLVGALLTAINAKLIASSGSVTAAGVGTAIGAGIAGVTA
jgi:CO dehydrogenase/acetyl-CoA synthase delta subunit